MPLTILQPMWDYPAVIVTLDAKRRFSIPAALARPLRAISSMPTMTQ